MLSDVLKVAYQRRSGMGVKLLIVFLVGALATAQGDHCLQRVPHAVKGFPSLTASRLHTNAVCYTDKHLT